MTIIRGHPGRLLWYQPASQMETIERTQLDCLSVLNSISRRRKWIQTRELEKGGLPRGITYPLCQETGPEHSTWSCSKSECTEGPPDFTKAHKSSAKNGGLFSLSGESQEHNVLSKHISELSSSNLYWVVSVEQHVGRRAIQNGMYTRLQRGGREREGGGCYCNSFNH